MISVIVPTLNDERLLAACLAPLLPAAMEGLVRELVVVDAGSTDATLEVADDAGAKILKDGGDFNARLAAGCAAARGPWLLLLEPRVRLEAGWESAVLAHVNARRTTARFRLQASDGGLLSGLFPPKALALLALKTAGGGVGYNGHALGSARLLDARGWA